jgi:predicted transcriptional regulator
MFLIVGRGRRALARKRSNTLTDAELRLMEVLWKRGAATVGEVVEGLDGGKPLAYNTVLTTLRILEQKGYIKHTKEGRAFVYHPLVERGDALRSAVRNLVSRFFNSSPELLVLNVIESEKIDVEELKRLKHMIEESE